MAGALPFAPRPRSDELPSSWLGRTAAFYDVSVAELREALWTAGPKAQPDVRWDPHEARSVAAGLRVDDDALARARMSWRPPPPALDARPGSLLDAVRLHPDRYRALGFFLEKIPLTEPEARTERAASMAVARSRRERDLIAACSVHDMFTGLTEAEVRDTPPFFIEFWQTSGEGIRVFGRRVEHRDRENGTLYTSKDARAVGRQVPGGMPSLAEAARNDNATVRALLARRRSGARFLGPDALVRAMEEH